MKAMKMMVCVALAMGFSVLGLAAEGEGVLSAVGIIRDGKTPCSDAIQRLIDQNPNREIYFPDGTYLLDKPICTPAHPKRSVSLHLSTFAIFKASPDWKSPEAMVRLGGIHPANDIRTAGSWYWFKGGIIDGSGVASGISIDSGRETMVAEVSMKRVKIGLRIKHGANSGSSDSDIRNVNIVGTGKADSIGVLVEGYDNTIANMRIAGVFMGVVVKSGGNRLINIHPLLTCCWDIYDKTVGFQIDGDNNWGDFCYSDQFSTGFRFGPRGGGVFDHAFCFWYRSGKDMRHVGMQSEGKFNAVFDTPTVCFRQSDANNALVIEGERGGNGRIETPRCNLARVRDPAHRGLAK